MSLQSDKLGSMLILILGKEEVQSEVGLDKILNNPLHRGIRVDFYVPKYNCIIEVHGQQHESAQSFGRSKVDAALKLSQQLDRDSKLRTVCSKFGLNYIEFWYNEDITIKSILDKLSSLTY